MRAITVLPGSKGSARLDDLAEPLESAGSVLVEGLALGICGTDVEIADGDYGWAPPGKDRLVLGHESLGRVLEAPESSGLDRGDLVVGIVRRPDPVPCPNCAIDEWDMCRNGRYTEHGIKELDGFGAERWRIEPELAVKVDPGPGDLGVLLEPASVVAKAWEHVERIGGRARWEPERVLVTGAGPIGLLAALLGVQRRLEVHVLDRVTEGPKPDLVRDLGATYHHGSVDEACQEVDVVVECTGVGEIVFDVMDNLTPNGVVCLAGVSSGGRTISIDAGALNRELVLSNNVIVGSVNANRRHYQQAATALANADKDWLGRLVTRRVPLDRFEEALERGPHDIKVIVQLTPK
jgi:threonine dehydrogenase-like Zn-dependent dehydrogenase